MSKSVFDYQGLCERVAGRLDVVDELLQLLHETFPGDRQHLLERLHAADAVGAREVAHRVKGQLQTLGLNNAAEQARHIELLARDGRLDDALAALAELDREFQRFKDLAVAPR